MLATLITRGFQALFAVVVLGVSIHAVRWQEHGSAPAVTSYSAFAGAFGLLTALIGIASIWISVIPALIMAAVDALASLILLAGGIAFAHAISGIDCSKSQTQGQLSGYDIVNGGCHKVDGEVRCAYEPGKPIENRCHAVEADTAFLFLGFIACLGAAVLAFMAHRRGGSTKHSAV